MHQFRQSLIEANNELMPDETDANKCVHVWCPLGSHLEEMGWSRCCPHGRCQSRSRSSPAIAASFPGYAYDMRTAFLVPELVFFLISGTPSVGTGDL
jgi:hypothetical protein